jgi:hypothetical protein
MSGQSPRHQGPAAGPQGELLAGVAAITASTLDGRMHMDFPPLVEAAIENNRHAIAFDDDIFEVLEQLGTISCHDDKPAARRL